MSLWSHGFSQNVNKKLSEFLPGVVRAEILTFFCSYFGRNDDFINSLWNCLTFTFYMISFYARKLVIFVFLSSCLLAKTNFIGIALGNNLHGPIIVSQEFSFLRHEAWPDKRNEDWSLNSFIGCYIISKLRNTWRHCVVFDDKVAHKN